MSDRFHQVALAIEQAVLIGQAASAIREHGHAHPLRTGWMPYNLFGFGALLLEAVPAVPDRDPAPRLLEVGAGPGANLELARGVFGFEVHGIEIDDDLAAVARGIGLDVQTADAASWKGYGDFEVIWLNRPLRAPDAELALEQRIQAEMADGAVIICANLEAPPPSASFFPVLDDWASSHQGIWYKIR